jgi:hypothetical protein
MNFVIMGGAAVCVLAWLGWQAICALFIFGDY